MVKYITDLNIKSLNFDHVECGMLIFNHRQFTRFQYRAAASIKYVKKGKVSYSIEGQEVNLRSGNYLFVNEGVEVLTTVAEASEGYSIFLDKNMPFHHRTATFPILETRLIKNIEKLRCGMIRGAGQPIQSLQEHLNGYLDQINGHQETLSLKTAHARMDIIKKLLLARSIIERNPRSALSLDDLAEHSGMSKYELIRRFKEVFGITPYKFYLHNKIEATKSELLRGRTLLQIAASYQIGDAFAYSKLFKKITGLTPSDYRDRNIT